jgi:hypothetical protein
MAITSEQMNQGWIGRRSNCQESCQKKAYGNEFIGVSGYAKKLIKLI